MVSCELKCITSSCFIMVKYRCDGPQVVFVFVCVWSSRFPLHPSLWQRRTNQSPPCLFSFHHTPPTSSSISRPALMKTHGGRIISHRDGLAQPRSGPTRPRDAIYWVCVCGGGGGVWVGVGVWSSSRGVAVFFPGTARILLG